MITCVCFEHSQFICMNQLILKHPSPRSLMVFLKIQIANRNSVVSMDITPIVEDGVQKSNLIYAFDKEDGVLEEKIARKSFDKNEITKNFYDTTIHIVYVNKINNFSNISDAQFVIPFSKCLITSTATYLL